MSGFFLLTLCFLCVCGVFGVEVKTVKEGNSVTLNSDVTKKHHETMLWYFNDTRIALISGDRSTSCLYDGEGGIFRDRLEVNYETGSLTITNIRSEHTGRYELEYIRKPSPGTSTSLNRTSKCDRTKIRSKPISDDKGIIKSFSVIVTANKIEQNETTEESGNEKNVQEKSLSAGVTAGIVVVVVVVLLVFVVVGVIYYCRKRSRNSK